VTPVMLHRAMFGSLERFIGILIEHFGGHLPLWLSPLQAVVATITDDADGYAREVIAAAGRAGLRAEEDLRNEKINYKVREHSLAKVPALLVVGRKEAAERTVSIRRLGKEGQTVLPLDAALKALADEAVPPDVRRVKQVDSKQIVGGPQEIEIDVRSASLRQIHDAIDHLHKSDYVSAITLASAAEGILPHTDNPHLFQKLKALSDSLPKDPEGATGVNAFTNWTKHGPHKKATISELEVIATIVRATSKFTALYDEQSQKMKDFSEWAIARLQADKK
jgi:hypothetical protein